MYSIIDYTGNGSNKVFSIPFPYIATSDVEVYVAGVLKTHITDYSFLSSTQIQFVTAPVAATVVRIKRNTQKTTKLVDFTEGSILGAGNLDLSADQMLFVMQELYDGTATNIEGTWSPTIVQLAGAGTLTLTNTSYIKIGKILYLFMDYAVTTADYSRWKISIPYPSKALMQGATGIQGLLTSTDLDWVETANKSASNSTIQLLIS